MLPLDASIDEKGGVCMVGFTLLEFARDELGDCVAGVTPVEFVVAEGSGTDVCGLVLVIVRLPNEAVGVLCEEVVGEFMGGMTVAFVAVRTLAER